MTSTHRRPALLGAASLAALAVLLAAAPVRAVEPGTTATPAEAAADWLAAELEAKDGARSPSASAGPDEFADQGLTIDAVLALLAAGAGDDPAVDLALDAAWRPTSPTTSPGFDVAGRARRQRDREDAVARGDLRAPT